MATKVSLYNDKWIEQITYQKSLEEYGESNTKLINNLKNILKCAIKNELTEKQKNILQLYYYDEYNMEQIAQKYSVNKSTICRHIHNAMKKNRTLYEVCKVATKLLIFKKSLNASSFFPGSLNNAAG